jgi:DNA-binding response OmpR family regulator
MIRVLLVESDRKSADATEAMLKAAHYEVVVAASVAAAIAAIPDVQIVVTSAALEGEGGGGVLGTTVANVAVNKRVHAIILTALKSKVPGLQKLSKGAWIVYLGDGPNALLELMQSLVSN